jgi:hypothetical protein
MSRTPLIDRLEDRKLMATFAVTSVADTSAAGTLRWAITQANATPAADVINFNIAGASKTISLAGDLTITQPVTIDATTQPGYAGSPIVRIDNPTNAANSGLTINAASCVVRGLSITQFTNGLFVQQPSVTIEKCWLGLDTAAEASPNLDGIKVSAAGRFVNIRNNVISGNSSDGVELNADDAVFTGNIIGMDPTGLLSRRNAHNGIRVVSNGDNFRMGDVGDANRNIVSANGRSGVLFSVAASNGLIINNYFGLDKTGNNAFNNDGNSISATAATRLVVGMTDLGNRFAGNAIELGTNSLGCNITGNVIGVGVDPSINVGGNTAIQTTGNLHSISDNVIGNMNTGIDIEGSNNAVTGNYIGTLPDGRSAGGSVGVFIYGSGNSVVANRIANFSSVGVKVTLGNNNTFDNQAWANGQSYHYDLGQNDTLGSYTPSIQNISENAAGNYNVNVGFHYLTPAGAYRVSIYASTSAGNVTSGHTQQLVHTSAYTTPGNSAGARNFTIPGAGLESKFLTAVITEDLGNGSFGSTGMPSPSMVVAGTPGLESGAFEFETRHACRFKFTSITNASVAASDVQLRNLSNGQTYTATSISSSADGFRFIRSTPLPDGNYEAVIPVGAVSNTNGTNRQEIKFPFHVLAGDVNRDKAVNFGDLLVLAQNYGQSNRTFSQGDFNYDGQVNFSDLLLLAQRYGSQLSASSNAAAPVKQRVATSIFA